MPVVATPSALEDTVRRLAGFNAALAPVTTCYLDVDGRRLPRHADVERRLTTVLRDGRQRLNGMADDPSVRDDLRRIEDWVRAGFDRSRTRGLAIFSCAAEGLFEVAALPFPVRNRLVVNSAPAIGQLESILQDHEPIAVLLADRQRARLLVFALGELTDRTELVEPLPKGDAGHADRGDLAGAAEAEVHHHLRHAADLAWRVFQDRPFSHLAIGAPDAIAGELEALLHPYLRDRLCGRAGVPVGAGLVEIRDNAIEIERAVDRRREGDLVEKLRDAAHSGGRGVVGLAATLAALNERRVETLLVSDGYEEEGWRCPTSGALAAVGPTSPVTGERMERVDDVMVDAIDLALATRCRVEVCVDNADLDVLGRIGALLRF
ncbi:MAG: hypothetical protein H0W25_17320 [Acidimicrobiia bacterium]|nr:hypothetical protein [Acidimicrobiia bacterium]